VVPSLAAQQPRTLRVQRRCATVRHGRPLAFSPPSRMSSTVMTVGCSLPANSNAVAAATLRVFQTFLLPVQPTAIDARHGIRTENTQSAVCADGADEQD
jgi:hypothetical protein